MSGFKTPTFLLHNSSAFWAKSVKQSEPVSSTEECVCSLGCWKDQTRVMHMKSYMKFPVSKMCSRHISDYKHRYMIVNGLKN